MACAIDCVRRGLPTARLYAVICLLLLGGAVLLALRNFGLLPSNPLTVNALQAGSTVAMLLLAFGLAARVNELKRLKVVAQASALAAQRHSLQALQEQERLLEQRVAERTEALAAANERLRELAMKDTLTGLANRMALRQHLEQAAAPYVADGQTLKIDVLDVDLAGRVEPASRPDDVRVLRGEADWPRIHLRYTLDAGGRTLRQGDAWLADMAYLQRLPPPDRGLGLAYERRMIDEWFRAEFKR